MKGVYWYIDYFSKNVNRNIFKDVNIEEKFLLWRIGFLSLYSLMAFVFRVEMYVRISFF